MAAGGDGTAREVVSGLLSSPARERGEPLPPLGVLPLGTGGDLRRSLGLAADLREAAGQLRGEPAPVDAGRIDYLDEAGKSATSFFLNIASFGLSGLTDRLVARVPRHFGGTVAFALASSLAILRHRSEPVALRVDGEPLYDGPLVLGAAANGRCFGGGMQLAPHAGPADGRFDVVLVTDPRAPRLLANLPSIYGGRHLTHPAVRTARGRVLEADATPGRVWLDIDGEPLGTLPARIEVLPRALSVLGATPIAAR